MLQVISITEMILTLALAWGLDLWVNLLRKNAAVGFNYAPYVLGIAVANLLVAGLWVYLAWGMLSRMPDSRWVSITYFFGGLLVTILVAVQLTVPESWRGLLLFEETRMFRLMVMGVIGLTSRFTLSAAFICILGVVGFLAPSDGR